MGNGLAGPFVLTALLAALGGVVAYLPLIASAASISCSEQQVAQAQNVMQNMAALGTALSRNGHVEYSFLPTYDEMTSLQRKLVIEGYAGADTCIHGFAREIHFYRSGKLVGKSGQDATIEIYY